MEVSRWVNGGTGDTNFFTEDLSLTWRVDGGLAVFDFLAETRLLETGRVYGRLINTNFLTEG